MMVCAAGVISYGLYSLASVLVPLTLAIALTYLLNPLIDMLSVRPLKCCGVTCCKHAPVSLRTTRPCLRPLMECFFQAKLPRPLAVVISLLVAFGVLGLLGFVVADSIHIFTKRAPLYSQRVQAATFGFIEYTDRMRTTWMSSLSSSTIRSSSSTAADKADDATLNAANATRFSSEDLDRLSSMASKIPVTQFIVHALGSLMDALSNLALVLLFAVYLLLGSEPKKHAATSADAVTKKLADAQIHTYIRGKVAMSLLVGVLTAAALGGLGVDLWLVFALLAFWLNFIPNVGTLAAVLLPMPLVVLDPSFSAAGVALALLLPLSAHAFAGNVLEPLLFGHTLKLHPVTVLLSLMLWGTVWGVTGMVLAVPITAVARIRLAAIDHPVPQFVAALLVGDDADDSRHGAISTAQAAERQAGAEMTPPVELPRAAEDGRRPLIEKSSTQSLPREVTSVVVDVALEAPRHGL